MDPHLERLQREIASTIAGLSAEQLNRRAPGKWSVGEVLEHLYLTYTGTSKGFERVVQAGKLTVTSATWRQRGRKFVVLGFSYLPSGREAPPFARPKGLLSEKVKEEIAQKIAEMDAAIARCEEKFGTSNQLLDHPILGPLTGAQWRKFHLVHGRHHLKQIEQRKVVGN